MNDYTTTARLLDRLLEFALYVSASGVPAGGRPVFPRYLVELTVSQ